VGYHVYLRHDFGVLAMKTLLKSAGPVTADLTTTVVHSYICKLVLCTILDIYFYTTKRIKDRDLFD